ncbi:MAG TPA: DUF6152 family protein, partial [Terriglobia bacterium]|nr:DUF6152 family protein [Terriglobia bacterium]
YLVGLLAIPLALLVLSAPVLAHHGGAAYDTSKMTTLSGTITEFQFIQPHPIIYLDVKGANGNVEKWFVEMTAPNHLVHYGWSGHKLHAGEMIKVQGNAAKNGNKVLNLRHIFDADGKEIPLGPPPEPGQT